jgi:hypothetical protein
MKKVTKVPFFLFLLFLGTRVFAQDPSNPGSDPGGEVAPINDFIIPMLLIGLVLGYRMLVAKDKIVQNN